MLTRLFGVQVLQLSDEHFPAYQIKDLYLPGAAGVVRAFNATIGSFSARRYR
jgi:hypothetical protein